METSEFDFVNFLSGFADKHMETKAQVTKLYVEGTINKEEFIRRMRNAKD